MMIYAWNRNKLEILKKNVKLNTDKYTEKQIVLEIIINYKMALKDKS